MYQRDLCKEESLPSLCLKQKELCKIYVCGGKDSQVYVNNRENSPTSTFVVKGSLPGLSFK